MTESATDPEVGRDAPNSLLGELRAKRESLSREREPQAFEIPGYGDALVAKYRVLGFEEQRVIAERMAKMLRTRDDDAPLKAAADRLIEACVGFYTREDGKLVPLEDRIPGADGPVRYDLTLARAVGLELGEGAKARDVVFGVLVKPEVLVEHAYDVESWMGVARTEDDEDF